MIKKLNYYLWEKLTKNVIPKIVIYDLRILKDEIVEICNNYWEVWEIELCARVCGALFE